MSKHVLTLAAARAMCRLGRSHEGFQSVLKDTSEVKPVGQTIRQTTLTSSGDTAGPFVPDAGPSGDNISQGFLWAVVDKVAVRCFKMNTLFPHEKA